MRTASGGNSPVRVHARCYPGAQGAKRPSGYLGVGARRQAAVLDARYRIGSVFGFRVREGARARGAAGSASAPPYYFVFGLARARIGARRNSLYINENVFRFSPVIRPHSPVIRPHSPVIRPHSPVIRPHSPVIRPHSPVIRPHSPVMHR